MGDGSLEWKASLMGTTDQVLLLIKSQVAGSTGLMAQNPEMIAQLMQARRRDVQGCGQ